MRKKSLRTGQIFERSRAVGLCLGLVDAYPSALKKLHQGFLIESLTDL